MEFKADHLIGYIFPFSNQGFSSCIIVVMTDSNHDLCSCKITIVSFFRPVFW